MSYWDNGLDTDKTLANIKKKILGSEELPQTRKVVRTGIDCLWEKGSDE